MTEKKVTISPKWSSTTKLIVGLSLVAIVAYLIIYFRSLISSLLIAFVIAYLVYPMAGFLKNKLHITWRFSVNIIYLLVLIVLLGLLTWGGFALVDQVGSLVKFLSLNFNKLPEFLERLNEYEFSVGPFQFDFANFDLTTVGNELIKYIQPAISQAGTLFGSIAGSAAATIGWIAFMMLISYFVLVEAKESGKRLVNIDIPGYQDDVQRLQSELGQIWNAFLRGQFLIIFLTIVIYSIILGIMGVRYFYILAILAGLARFVPYLGPWITWITYFLVCVFQTNTLFGLSPVVYALIVCGVAMITDTVMDNLMVPRVFSGTLQVHPAAILVAAIVGASILGLVGIVLAAPVMATLNLFGNYILKKMFDKDPWEDMPRRGVSGRQIPFIKPFLILFRKTKKWILAPFKKRLQSDEKGVENEQSERTGNENPG